MLPHVPHLGFSLLILVATAFVAPRVLDAETTAAIPSAAAKEADDIFTTRCSLCHGANGKGDGAAAVGLNPKPRNYSDPTWQASVTDADIAKIIVEGGTAVGKSNIMPANPDLASKPDVVNALCARIRRFGPQPPAPTP